MVAISQAPSPESNPNPPLPVKGMVVHYTTINLIGGKFVQQRPRTMPRASANIGLRQQLHLPRIKGALVFVSAKSIRDHAVSGNIKRLDGRGLIIQVLAVRLAQVSLRKRRASSSLGRL